MKIAVDVGFGFVKAKSELGTEIMFPSVVGLKKHQSHLAQFGKQDDYVVELEENVYFVGDSAITNKKERNWNSNKKFDIETLKVLTLCAIALLSTQEEVELVIGLPISVFLKEKNYAKTALENIEADVIVNSQRKKIKIVDINVSVQGIGAYASLSFEQKNELSTSCAIVDIGYRTVDYIVVEKGKKGLNILEEFSGTLEQEGMNVAFDYIQKNLLDSKNFSISIIDIEKAILWNDSLLNVGGEVVDLRPYIEEAYKELAEKIKNQLNLKWQNLAENIPTIFISGGGGIELFDYLSVFYKQAILQKNARFSNVSGYLLM